MVKTAKKSKQNPTSSFHLEFLTPAQKFAWAAFQQHDVLFLIGPAGSGKSHLASAFAISEILEKKKKKIILTRPIVEAGEKLGFLPGSFADKTEPYMMPLYDCIDRIVPKNSINREQINSSIEVAPIAYLRGRTFHDSICILDEAQNATKTQIKLFLTRFGENSKVIITGDPKQSDISSNPDLIGVMNRLEGLQGVGIVKFKANSIVRHPLIASILEKLESEDK